MARSSFNEFDPQFAEPVDDDVAVQNLINSLYTAPLLNLIDPMFDEDQLNRSRDMLRDQMQQLEEKQNNNMLAPALQVAELPSVFDVAPVDKALAAARALSQPPPQSFEDYLQGVPVEQAQAMGRAYTDQQNLAAAIAQMQANIDDMAADQLAAERAAVEEQDQIAAMNALASAFGIGMEGATPDMGRAGMVAAWGNPVDEFADTVFGGEEEESAPGQMSTPFGVAMGTLGQNVDVNPMSAEFDPFSQHQMAAFDEEDPFGEDPFSNAAPAFSEPVSNVASFASPALAQAVAQAQVEQAMAANEFGQMQSQEDAEQAAQHDMLSGVFGNEPESVASLQHDPFGFTNMGSMQAMQAAAMEAAAQQQAANMANIGLSPEDMDNQAAQEQAANMSNLGLSPAGMQAAAAQDSYMSALSKAAQIAENALSPEAVAEVDAAIANLAASLADVPDDQAIQAMMEAFGSMMADAQQSAEDARASGQMGAAATPAQSMMGMTAGLGSVGFDPLSSAMSITDPAVAASLSGVGPESDDESPAMGPDVAAQSMSAAGLSPASLGSFSGADLGIDPLSDPVSTSLTGDLGFSGPADVGMGVSDPSASEGDESDDTGIGSLGGLGGIGDVSGADVGDADAGAASDASDAGVGDAGAGDAGAGGGDAGGSDSSGGMGDPASGIGGAGDDSSPFRKGGRVKGKSKGLGASLHGMKPKGLAARPYAC